jgi:SAM-dependent methyltransferase
MFRSSEDDPSRTPSMLAAAVLLGTGGTVLDVGCGGGRSSLPLGALAHHVTGVDEQADMLAQFTEAAAARGIPSDTVLGRWPDVATLAPTVDVVVCHHVAYNIGAIAPFVRALSDHARAGVVVELTSRHPQSSFNELWQRFWGLERPIEPTSDLFIDVVRELGCTPTVATAARTARPSPLDRSEMLAFVRQRLCLTADRDAEIDALLGSTPLLSADAIVTVSWRT